MSRRTKPALFNGYWYALDGRRLRRVRRDELAEAYRLRRKHTAIRLGVRPVGTTAGWGAPK